MSDQSLTRLHLKIAWRHLRGVDQAPRWVTPLLIISLYLIAIGIGFAVYASSLVAEPETSSLVIESLEMFGQPEPTVTPRQGYFGTFAAGTLFFGVMLLIGGLLSRVFTLLATVITFSVMLGCMALVVVLSLMTGLEHELRDKILGQRAHILVQAKPAQGEPSADQVEGADSLLFADYLDLAKELSDVPGVLGASPYLEGEIMVRNGLDRQGGKLTGIIPDMHAHVSRLPNIMAEGDYAYLDHPEQVPEPQFSFELITDGPSPSKKNTKKKKSSLKLAGDGKKGADTSDSPGKPGPMLNVFPEGLDTGLEIESGEPDETGGEDGPPAGWEDPQVELAADPQPEVGKSKTAKKGRKSTADDVWGESDRWEDPPPGEGWEDPSEEVPKLRAAGELPPKQPAAIPLLPPPTDDDEESWEDPEVEIEKLRDAGELPEQATPTAPTNSPDADTPKSSEPKTDPVDQDAIVDPVLIGSEKSEELGAHLGDEVQLITPIGRLTPAGRIPGVMSVKVAGVFDADHYEYDRWLVYTPLPVAQAFLRTGDRITGIEIRVEDIEHVREIKDSVAAVVAEAGRDDLRVQDWQELNRSLFSAMQLEKIAVFIALLCVIVVASFGILGSNLMSVLEKAKEIAILKTMGCTDRQIQKVFIAEGICLGVLGSIAGIAMGIGVCIVLARYGLPFASSGRGFERLPVSIVPFEVFLVGVSSIFIVWLSCLYPARVASKMRPVDAMRQAET